MPRPSWTEQFMSFAYEWAKMSTCVRTQVGAILVRDKCVIASGFNGAPRNMKHCSMDVVPSKVQCLREQMKIPSGHEQQFCRGVHAEQNAIIQAARFGVSTVDSIMYVTHQPCSMCARMIVNAGITTVIYDKPYPDHLGLDILHEGGVIVIPFRR